MCVCVCVYIYIYIYIGLTPNPNPCHSFRLWPRHATGCLARTTAARAAG